VELSIKLGNSAQSLNDLENYVTDVAVLANFPMMRALSACLIAKHRWYCLHTSTTRSPNANR